MAQLYSNDSRAVNLEIETVKNVNKVNMIVKFTVVIVYFMILFVVTRFLEFSGMLNRGMRCSEKWMDMHMLNAKHLQKVLDYRGISYRYVIERSELMSLVDISGNLWLILSIVINIIADNDFHTTVFTGFSGFIRYSFPTYHFTILVLIIITTSVVFFMQF